MRYGTTTKQCIDCGELFDVTNNIAWRTDRCEACRKEHRRKYFAARAERRKEEKEIAKREAFEALPDPTRLTVISDPTPNENERYERGATFGMAEMKYMLRHHSISPGVVLERRDQDGAISKVEVWADKKGRLELMPA